MGDLLHHREPLSRPEYGKDPLVDEAGSTAFKMADFGIARITSRAGKPDPVPLHSTMSSKALFDVGAGHQSVRIGMKCSYGSGVLESRAWFSQIAGTSAVILLG